MREREKLVEVMARAHIENICKNVPARLRIPYDAMDSDDQDALKENIRAQLAALEAAGVWLVPVVSTYKMDAEAAKSVWDIVDSFSMKDAPIIWDAMLAASPYAKDKPE